ncbi:MAG: hypothetical protein EBY20_09115 [Alphaproteobacteria bacterium]|nr:hypothetical protein [Alphaproteobacteria bacterium]
MWVIKRAITFLSILSLFISLQAIPANAVAKGGTSAAVNNKFTEVGTILDADLCKLKDARVKKQQPNNVGFPLQDDIIPVKGDINVIVIPVDFSDRPGGQLPSDYLMDQTIKMNEWYKFFSGDKVSLSFQIGKEWVRAPKADSEYVVPKSVANTAGVAVDVQFKMAQDIVTASKDQFDFKKSNVLFFYMPTVKSVDQDMGGRGVNLTTADGAKNFFFWGGGAYHFDNRNMKISVKKEKMWAFWIHEMLHSQGLALHSPANGSSTGLHADQYGSSLAIDSWELFRLGWIENANVACLDKSQAISNKLILKPVEMGSKLVRFAVVKLNSYEALVIESRRPILYSKEWKQNQKGILVYRIDVRNDNDRSGESTGDTGNSPKFSKWGYLLSPDNKNMNKLTPYEIERYILRANQTITYSKIKIKLLASENDQDLVQVTKS